MKLISDFKDYYDAGIAYGIDSNLVFIRKNFKIHTNYSHYEKEQIQELINELGIENFEKIQRYIPIISAKLKDCYQKSVLSNSIYYANETKENINVKLIGKLVFIGEKAYPIYTVTTYESGSTVWEEKNLKKYYFYDFKEVIEALSKIEVLKNGIDIFKWKQKTLNNFHQTFVNAAKNSELKKIIFEVQQLSNSPILIVSGGSGLEFNPILKDIKFSKCLGPFDCFQEISMMVAYLNDLKDKKEQMPFDDKTIRDSKGFDKYSFKHKP